MSRAIVPAGTRNAANALHFSATRKGAARCTRRQLSGNRALWRSSPCGDERPHGFVGSPAGCRIENLRLLFCILHRLFFSLRFAKSGSPRKICRFFVGLPPGRVPGLQCKALHFVKEIPAGNKKHRFCGVLVRPQGFEPGTH